MKKIILLLCVICTFLPATLYTQTLPGSVGDAIENEESFSFPVDQLGSDAGEPLPVEDEFFRGKVTKIITEHEDPGYGSGTNTEVFIQDLEVIIGEGIEKGKVVLVSNEVPLKDRDVKGLRVGDQLILGKSTIADQAQYYISDSYRLNSLWFVLAIFIGITILFTKFQGLKAFAGLSISFLVIGWFIVPYIIHGGNPLLVSLIGTTVIAATSIFIAHGFHIRTSIAFVGTIISIGIALGLSYLFVHVTHLFGMGSEDAFYLQFAPGTSINLRGLLLGGIIIGVMGILDDITTAQAAVVEQIYQANTSLSAGELYKRGSMVGREHILSLVNTLVLAYTGASLPLILLFKIYERPAWVTLNSEIIMEEIVRMLIGSITLIIAVPITTRIAAEYYYRKKPTIRNNILNQHTH